MGFFKFKKFFAWAEKGGRGAKGGGGERKGVITEKKRNPNDEGRKCKSAKTVHLSHTCSTAWSGHIAYRQRNFSLNFCLQEDGLQSKKIEKAPRQSDKIPLFPEQGVVFLFFKIKENYTYLATKIPTVTRTSPV